MVIEPVSVLESSSTICGIALAKDCSFIAVGDVSNEIKIFSIEGDLITSFEVKGMPNHMGITADNTIVIGTHESDLFGFDSSGNQLWMHAVGGGCDVMSQSSDGDLIACIDGAKVLHLVNGKGKTLGRYGKGELTGVCVNNNGTSVACYDDGGFVTTLDRSGQVKFTRSPRSEVGERIITAEFQDNGILVISKESLGVPLGDDEQNEIEWWNPLGQEVHRQGLPARCDVLRAEGNCMWLGLFNGKVMLINNHEEPIEKFQTDYSITNIIPLGEEALVASWFYLFKIGEDIRDEIWQIEHPGIVELLDYDAEKELVALAGNDRNDYTENEPVFLLKPQTTPKWLDEEQDEIDEDLRNIPEIDSKEIYSEDEKSYTEFLTDAERKQMLDQITAKPSSHDNLFAMLEDDTLDEYQIEVSSINTEDILSNLEDEEEGVVSNLPPVCDAGEDQDVNSEEDGTATVILDGSNSFDPDGEITLWKWSDGSGRSISDTPKFRLRLPKGNHMFTLTVTDDDGDSTTDSVIVKIE